MELVARVGNRNTYFGYVRKPEGKIQLEGRRGTK
jgi:hypothetical protein